MTAANATSQWVDIVAPATPPGSTTSSTLVLALVLLIAIAMLFTFQYLRRPIPRAKRALRRIDRDLRCARIETRVACFRVRSCLRHGLEHQARPYFSRDAPAQTDWHRYLNRLEHGCFASEPPSAAVLEELIREAIAWLNKKRPSADAVARS